MRQDHASPEGRRGGPESREPAKEEGGRHGGGRRRKARGRAAPRASSEDRRREDGWRHDLFRRREYGSEDRGWGHDLLRCELGTGRWGGEKPAASKKTEWKKNRRQVGSDALLGYEILIS